MRVRVRVRVDRSIGEDDGDYEAEGVETLESRLKKRQRQELADAREADRRVQEVRELKDALEEKSEALKESKAKQIELKAQVVETGLQAERLRGLLNDSRATNNVLAKKNMGLEKLMESVQGELAKARADALAAAREEVREELDEAREEVEEAREQRQQAFDEAARATALAEEKAEEAASVQSQLYSLTQRYKNPLTAGSSTMLVSMETLVEYSGILNAHIAARQEVESAKLSAVREDLSAANADNARLRTEAGLVKCYVPTCKTWHKPCIDEACAGMGPDGAQLLHVDGFRTMTCEEHSMCAPCWNENKGRHTNMYLQHMCDLCRYMCVKCNKYLFFKSERHAMYCKQHYLCSGCVPIVDVCPDEGCLPPTNPTA